MTNEDAQLFGLLAVRTGLVSEERLSTAQQECVAADGSDIAAVLERRGDLSEESRRHVERLVEQQKKMTSDEFEKSLATINPSDAPLDPSEGAAESPTPKASVSPDETVEFDPARLPKQDESGDQPADPNKTTWTPTEESKPVGSRYELIRSHAKGGMGLISLALDTELDREVAFKELQEYCADDKNSRARFVREAEITGKLEHPGVVPVYGLGAHPDGRPYYAMRFVQGDSLGEQIAQFHKRDLQKQDFSQNSLELRSLLGRFVDVCNAIAYAHSRGVLHRDLKPDNVMLGRFGETLVVDWGLAKLAGAVEESETDALLIKAVSGDASTATRMGSATGTPAYMSPEQASGQIDRLRSTSDVYSLGATLYCLLTGKAPIAGKSITEVLNKARKGDFLPPKEVDPRIPAVLNSICCKAMAREPENRYPTPLALAADVERWLSDETVSAHPENAREKLARWFRRHRTLALVGAGALAVIAAVSTISAVEINRQRAKAETLSDENSQLAEQEREAKQQATERFKESRATVDTWLTGFSEALADYPGVQAFREQVLLRAAEEYEGFVATEESDPELELERGRTLMRLGDVRHTLFQTDEAKKAYSEAKAVFERLVAESGSEAPPVELAQTILRTAILAEDTGVLDAATADYRLTIKIGEQILASDADSQPAMLVLAEARSRLGMLLAAQGKVDEGQELLLATVEQLESQVQRADGDTDLISALADSRIALGKLHLLRSDTDKAEASYQSAIASFDSLIDLQEDNPKFLVAKARALIHLAIAQRVAGNWELEAQAYEQAIDAYQRLIVAMPDVPVHRENLSLTQTDLGQLLRESYRPAEAIEQLQEARQVVERLVAEYPSMVRFHEERATCLGNLGQALLDMGKYSEALAVQKQSADIFSQLVESVPEQVQYVERHAISQSQLGSSLHALLQFDAAERQFTAAIESLKQQLAASSESDSVLKSLAMSSGHFADMLVAAEKNEQAGPVYRAASGYWKQLVERSPQAEYLYRAAMFHVLCHDESVRDAKLAVAYASRALEQAPTNPLHQAALAAAEYRDGKFALSVSLAKESLSKQQGNHGLSYFIQAMSQQQLGQADQAQEALQSALAWQAENAPGNLELNALAEEAGQLLSDSSDPAE